MGLQYAQNLEHAKNISEAFEEPSLGAMWQYAHPIDLIQETVVFASPEVIFNTVMSQIAKFLSY